MAIYLDYHATTPVDRRVLEEMLPYFGDDFGNPSSGTHAFGWRAAEAVARARAQVAQLIGASSDEITFTSGATESLNLAIRGAALAQGGERRHVITCATEHKAVLDTVSALARQGFCATVLRPRPDGVLDPREVERAIRPDTCLVAAMWVNNELGTIHPVHEIGALARARGILFVCDAAQALGRVPCDVGDVPVDLMSISAHKIYGPKGVGALYVRRGTVPLVPIQSGGGQEWGLRPGTLNVPGIVGLGAACALARRELADESARLLDLRERLRARLLALAPAARVNGSLVHRVPGNLNISFPGVDGDHLFKAIGGELAVSSAAACSGGGGPHVLKALGVSAALAQATVRFGLGRFTTAQEIDDAVDIIDGALRVMGAADALQGEALPSPRQGAPAGV